MGRLAKVVRAARLMQPWSVELGCEDSACDVADVGGAMHTDWSVFQGCEDSGCDVAVVVGAEYSD